MDRRKDDGSADPLISVNQRTLALFRHSKAGRKMNVNVNAVSLMQLTLVFVDLEKKSTDLPFRRTKHREDAAE
jgi:hypothetical protein